MGYYTNVNRNILYFSGDYGKAAVVVILFRKNLIIVLSSEWSIISENTILRLLLDDNKKKGIISYGKSIYFRIFWSVLYSNPGVF